jgi:hypothetical protein
MPRPTLETGSGGEAAGPSELFAERPAKAVAEEGRLTAGQVLEKVGSLKLKTPAESAAFVRQDRDAH